MKQLIIRAGQLTLAFVLVLSLISFAPTQADSIGSDFEGFSLGNINGQGGWSKTGGYDVAVVANTWGYSGFGSQSLRISNAVTSGSFGDHTFSPSTADEAGETTAENGGLSGGTRQPYYYAEFQVASAVPGSQQPGLRIQASPDRGDGARMSYVGLEDTASGILIDFYNYNMAGDSFDYFAVATVSRNTPHTVGIEMIFVDGLSNDIVNIYVDGTLMLTDTSWEDYFVVYQGGFSRTVDSIAFFTRGTAAPGTAGNGFVIDNVSVTTGPVPVAPVGGGLNLPDKIAQIKIDQTQAQPAYESADGGVARLDDGTEIWLPHDYDGNFFDTYDVYGTQTIDGRVWVEIFLGSETLVWVPLDKVTPLSYITD